MYSFKKKLLILALIVPTVMTVFLVNCGTTPTDKDTAISKIIGDVDPLDPGPELGDSTGTLPFHLTFEEYDANLITCFMDTVEQKVTFYFQFLSGPSDTIYKNLIIDLYDSVNIYGFTSTLVDNSNYLLWEYNLSIDTLNTENMRFVERTQADSMTIERIVDDTSITEIYTINGIGDEFVFHTTDQERISELHYWLLNSLDEDPPGGWSSLDSEIIATIEDFHEFYPTDNSLHNNPDGFLVNEIMGSEPLEGWFIEAFPADSAQPLDRPKWADVLCDAATICSVLKCPEGLNPACSVCLAIGATCVIMDHFHLW